MHVFPRENRIPLGEIAIKCENNHEIYHFPVWRRKSGHVVRSRSHTCEKISTGGKKDLLSLLGGNKNQFQVHELEFRGTETEFQHPEN